MRGQTIYIDDSFDYDGKAQAKKLVALSVYADQKKYLLTDNPDNCDIILICGAEFSNYCEKLRRHKLLKKHTEKCFVLSNIDRPINLYRGLYTSAEKSFFNFQRIRSCSYTAYYDPYKNSFIANHIYNGDTEKKYLFSFIGRRCDKSRDQIFRINFNRKDILIQDSTETYNLYDKELRGSARQKIYYETLVSSKFSLCPRGWGASSYRLFESMQLGIAPVIISDEWILPDGPKWEDFSIIIKAKDLSHLENIIAAKENKYIEMGKLAKAAFYEYFCDSKYFNYVIANCLEIKSRQFLPESLHYYLNFILLFIFKEWDRIRNIWNRIVNVTKRHTVYKNILK